MPLTPQDKTQGSQGALASTVPSRPASPPHAATGDDREEQVPETVLREGGSWIAAARGWIKWHCHNGSDVHWGSDEILRPYVSVRQAEEIAAHAVAADRNDRARRLLASPAAPAETAPAGDWWCPRCKEALDGSRVTYQERCDTCGSAVEWVEALPSILSALSSASATEAALRAEVRRLTDLLRESQTEEHVKAGRLAAAESREAALRAERDEACEALGRLAGWVESSLLMGADTAKSLLRQEAAISRSVLARIRKETPDHE